MTYVTYTQQQFVAKKLRENFGALRQYYITYGAPAVAVGLLLAISGTVPPLLAALPFLSITGMLTAAGLSMTAADCRDAHGAAGYSFDVKEKPSRLLRPHQAFLAAQLNEPPVAVFLAKTNRYFAGFSREAHATVISKGILRTTPDDEIIAILAHECGHGEDRFDARWPKRQRILLENTRMTCAAVGGSILGAAIALPVMAALPFVAAALLTMAVPYGLHLRTAAIKRQDEYAADRFAAAACGTPVPLMRNLKYGETRGQMSAGTAAVNTHIQSRFGRLAQRGAGKLKELYIKRPHNLGQAFFTLAVFSGPFTSTHPTTRQRRAALVSQPRNRAQIAALKAACKQMRRPYISAKR